MRSLTGGIAIPLALAGCALPLASLSPTPPNTATLKPIATLTPTPPPPTSTPQPSPTAGFFLPPAFSISEVPGAAEDLSLELDPRFTSPPPGDYMLDIWVSLNREDTGPRLVELRYASLDGLTRGRILSVRKDLSLVGASPTLNLLHLADFNQDEVMVYTVDWQQGAARQLRLVGKGGLSNEEGFWSVLQDDDGSYALSPDGRWLVWDCEPEGQYAWCLLDLEEEAGYTIVPGGELRSTKGRRYPAYFHWAPNGEWFLAECADLANAGRPTQCAVFTQTHQVYRTVLTYDYILRDGCISPQGDDLFVFLHSPVEAQDESVMELAVLEDGCFLDMACSPRTLLSFSWLGGDAVWTPSGEQIALDFEVLKVVGTTVEYLHEIRLVNVADGSFRVLGQNLRGGLLGWQPDGKSLLIGCRGKYELCGLSTEGLFRPILPDVEGWNTHFLTWWQVP